MKATIKFDLSNEDDLEDFNLFNKRNNMFLAISEMQTFLRSQNKYNDDFDSKIYEKWREILSDNELDV